MNKTKDGVILCKDGFHATTHSAKDFEQMGKTLNNAYEIEEVNNSSLFLIITKDK